MTFARFAARFCNRHASGKDGAPRRPQDQVNTRYSSKIGTLLRKSQPFQRVFSLKTSARSTSPILLQSKMFPQH
jgi:hypothetical protein